MQASRRKFFIPRYGMYIRRLYAGCSDIVRKFSPKRKGKCKRGGPHIVTDVPLNDGELFHEVTVTRHKKRIQTTSRPVYVPLPSASQLMDAVPDPPEHGGDVYSDEEGAQPLPATRNCERKGPSRSVSVCLLHLRHFSTSITDNDLDADRRVVGVQGRVHR